MKKAIAILVIVSVCVNALVGCSNNKETIKKDQIEDTKQIEKASSEGTSESNDKAIRIIRLAASDSADYPLCKADSRFAEEVADLSNGSIEVQCFFDGVLGEETDTVESLNLDMLEMSRVSAGNMSTFVPELALFNLPFLFKDEEHFKKVINGEVGDIYSKLFEDAGFKLLTFYNEGTRNLFNKTKCITSPDDLAGLKIRTMGAQSIQDGFVAMGASPTPMNSGEVYTSLSQGVLDACENNYSTVYTLKWYESAKYFSNTEHLRVPSVLLCSMDYWNSLSEEEKNIIMEAISVSVDYAEDTFNTAEEDAFKAILADGGIYQELTDIQRAAFAENCSSIYQKYATNDTAKEILDIIAELGK